jgi:alpha-glucosidase
VLHARLGHSEPASYGFRSRYAKDTERLKQPAVINGPITTPWRIVLIGESWSALMNSDIIHNVSAPPDPKLFPKGIKEDWIKPGRAVWGYLDGGDRTVEGQKQFVRLAQQLGFEYIVVEGTWSGWPEAQLKEFVDYSRERGVRVLIWSSRASLQDPKIVDAHFAMCNRTGVAGAKIDFFDHENKEVVDLYEMLAKKAAEHKLLVDFHGANKPTGLERTYPNIVGIEGVRGMEFFPPRAELDVVLPFTRMLAGMADYTPTHFGALLADTTWAHQVANAVILQAPLLVYAAHPANMLANPSVDVLKKIPSVWDETVVLPVSELRQVAAIARRSGDTWFLAVTNGATARNIRIDLSSFLGGGAARAGAAGGPGRGGSYLGTLLRDTNEPAALKVEHLTLSSMDTLTVDLRSGGGFVAMLAK